MWAEVEQSEGERLFTEGYIVSFVRCGKRAYANDAALAIEVDEL